MIHPLLNPKSFHYLDENKKTTIEKMEEELTVNEQLGWCKGNIFKYTDRQDRKGQKDSDIEKIADFERYFDFLYQCYLQFDGDTICKDAYECLNIEVEYIID